ncbi:cache domain-containing protein [Reyranella massiliensis]|uniref:cache domain-containing protein n=1 Tax=Reyranella massiliensis TaxID=445220 RepID=UPI0002D922E0|nr:cache domain-containing protein [Reyranella massiliensis]
MARPPKPAARTMTNVMAVLTGTGRSGRNEASWWTWLRRSLPVMGVVAVVLLISLIAFYVYESNRRGAVVLSNDLITAIDRRVEVQMHAYLSPAQQFLELAGAAAQGRDVAAGGPEAERFALSALPTVGPVTGFSYADPEGNFQFIVRNEQGGYDTKTIDVRNGARRVTWVRRDAAGKVTATETDPTDTFDPRTRPWYQGAEQSKKPFWTPTYLFFTVKKPGISLAVPSYDADGKLANVLGVDIELATLCTFLKQLDIGVSGKALIIDKQGRVVAYPSDDWLPADRPDVTSPMLDELGDPVLTRVYNRLRVEGYGRQVLDIDERRIIVSSEPVRMLSGHDWVVLIVVPETDFVGFVVDSGWAALLMSLVVVLLVAGLTGLMAWRSMLADRRASAAATRQQALELRTQAFVDLAQGAATADGLAGGNLQSATESAATACDAKRVAIWRLTADRRTLTCEDCFDRTVEDHTAGLELHRDEMPHLFAALDKGMPINASDASRDRRTSELFASYLKPLGISRAYLAPIVAAGQPIGLLSVEDPRQGDRAAGLAAFCDALSILLALRFTAATPGAPAAAPALAAAAMAPPAEERPPDSFLQRQARLERTLLQQGAALEDVREASVDRAAVGVIKLPTWTSVTQRPSNGGQRTAMDEIVHELRLSIEQSGATYAAMLDDQIVVAAFSPEADSVGENARCVATAMLALRDRLIEFEDQWGTSLDFRLAIDIGTVMISTVGTEPPTRSLWGGALGVAKVLAATAGRRSVAASETAYEVLSGDFLFRPRGSYFLPETGTMRTFVMVGRT